MYNLILYTLPYLFIQDSASIHILNCTCVHETNLHILFSSLMNIAWKLKKNIRIWHSVCSKDFLFWPGISKKFTWLCLPENAAWGQIYSGRCKLQELGNKKNTPFCKTYNYRINLTLLEMARFILQVSVLEKS